MVRSRKGSNQLDQFGDFVVDKIIQLFVGGLSVLILVALLSTVIGSDNAQRIGDAFSIDPYLITIGKIGFSVGGLILIAAIIYLAFQEWKKYN